MTPRISLVVSLWVKQQDVAAFESFERMAAEIMSRHGGRIEMVIRCPDAGVEGGPFEVHIVTFPSDKALQQYRDDPRHVEIRALRERVIARTEIWRGQEVQPYGTQTANR